MWLFYKWPRKDNLLYQKQQWVTFMGWDQFSNTWIGDISSLHGNQLNTELHGEKGP